MSGCSVRWRMKARQTLRLLRVPRPCWLHCSARKSKTSWCSAADCSSQSSTCTPCAWVCLSVLLSRLGSTAWPAGGDAMPKLLISWIVDVSLHRLRFEFALIWPFKSLQQETPRGSTRLRLRYRVQSRRRVHLRTLCTLGTAKTARCEGKQGGDRVLGESYFIATKQTLLCTIECFMHALRLTISWFFLLGKHLLSCCVPLSDVS